MSEGHTQRWCPHCRQVAPQATLLEVGARFEPVVEEAAADTPRGRVQKRYCAQCQQMWRSIDLPVDYVHELAAAADELEEARRQITMLRLLLASQRREPIDAPTAPLSKAA